MVFNQHIHYFARTAHGDQELADLGRRNFGRFVKRAKVARLLMQFVEGVANRILCGRKCKIRPRLIEHGLPIEFVVSDAQLHVAVALAKGV